MTDRTADGTTPEGVEGAAFPRLLRGLALLSVLALGWQTASTLQARPELALERETLWLAGLTYAVILAGLWHMLSARTSIDATHIMQAGLWRRRLALSDVRRVDILHLPGLDWLIAPRARLHTAGRGSYVFHASDPRVMERLWQLALGEQVSA